MTVRGEGIQHQIFAEGIQAAVRPKVGFQIRRVLQADAVNTGGTPIVAVAEKTIQIIVDYGETRHSFELILDSKIKVGTIQGAAFLVFEHAVNACAIIHAGLGHQQIGEIGTIRCGERDGKRFAAVRFATVENKPPVGILADPVYFPLKYVQMMDRIAVTIGEMLDQNGWGALAAFHRNEIAFDHGVDVTVCGRNRHTGVLRVGAEDFVIDKRSDEFNRLARSGCGAVGGGRRRACGSVRVG